MLRTWYRQRRECAGSRQRHPGNCDLHGELEFVLTNLICLAVRQRLAWQQQPGFVLNTWTESLREKTTFSFWKLELAHFTKNEKEYNTITHVCNGINFSEEVHVSRNRVISSIESHRFHTPLTEHSYWVFWHRHAQGFHSNRKRVFYHARERKEILFLTLTGHTHLAYKNVFHIKKLGKQPQTPRPLS